jgi:hypothetical protein
MRDALTAASSRMNLEKIDRFTIFMHKKTHIGKFMKILRVMKAGFK